MWPVTLGNCSGKVWWMWQTAQVPTSQSNRVSLTCTEISQFMDPSSRPTGLKGSKHPELRCPSLDGSEPSVIHGRVSWDRICSGTSHACLRFSRNIVFLKDHQYYSLHLFFLWVFSAAETLGLVLLIDHNWNPDKPRWDSFLRTLLWLTLGRLFCYISYSWESNWSLWQPRLFQTAIHRGPDPDWGQPFSKCPNSVETWGQRLFVCKWPTGISWWWWRWRWWWWW